MTRIFEPGRKFIVYLVTNTINEKRYVGITSQTLKKRQQGHLADVEKNRYKCVFHRAICKYGMQSFRFEHIASCSSWDDACETEKYLIKNLSTQHPSGYNQTAGGEGAYGVIVSEETRQKRSKAARGRRHSDESKVKMRLHQQESWQDPIQRQRFIESFKKRKYSKEYRDRMAEWARTFHTGRKQTFEEIEKRMLSIRGKKQRPEVIRATSDRQKIFYSDPQHRKELSIRMSGKKRSDKFREECRDRQLGKKCSLATRQRMSESHSGKKLSSEGRKNMSVAAKKRGVARITIERSLAVRRYKREQKIQSQFLMLSSAALFRNYLTNQPQQRSA